MTTLQEMHEAISTSSTKREAADRLLMTASSLGSRVFHTPKLLAMWRKLPSDGAFAGRSRHLPGPCVLQAEADALVAEAVADAPIDPAAPQRPNIVRLMLAMYAIKGDLNFPRGWVRATILVFREAGAKAPTTSSLRWYRSYLVNAPAAFASIEGIDLQLIEDIERLSEV